MKLLPCALVDFNICCIERIENHIHSRYTFHIVKTSTKESQITAKTNVYDVQSVKILYPALNLDFGWRKAQIKGVVSSPNGSIER